MSYQAPSGNMYKLCLLDTNAVSEILKYPKKEGKGFIRAFPPNEYVPCFTIYNLIELRRSPELYDLFINMLSVYPILLLKPQSMIFNLEFENYNKQEAVNPILNVFSPLGRNDSYNLSLFINELFSLEEMSDTEKHWRENEEETLKEWISNKANFNPRTKFPNKEDAERYISEAGFQTLAQLNLNWCKQKIDQGIVPEIDKFPSVKMMLYSIYYRLYDPAWVQKPNEVTDVSIISVVPYVDCFVTEKFQANIHNKIVNNVKGLRCVEVYRIRDLIT